MIQHMIDDNEPFSLNQRSEEEMANYGAGFNAGLAGENADENQSEAWLRGWAEAHGESVTPAESWASRRGGCAHRGTPRD
jgi:ribosome modulation factor